MLTRSDRRSGIHLLRTSWIAYEDLATVLLGDRKNLIHASGVDDDYFQVNQRLRTVVHG